MNIRIIEQTPDIIVCVKPAGIPVQTKRIGEQDMVSILRNMTRGEVYVIHRLDQPVEGITVWARNARTAAYLNSQLTGGAMSKKYMALVRNADDTTGTGPLPDEGELIDYIRKDVKTNVSSVVSEKDPSGKRSILKYRVVERYEKYTLVEIELVTGRHHQIRVQFSSRGWPLAGDRKYGGNPVIENRKDAGCQSGAVVDCGTHNHEEFNKENDRENRKNPEKHEKSTADHPESRLCLCAYKLSFTDTDGAIKEHEIKPSWLN